MDPIALRLTTFKDGAEIQTAWTFTPLRRMRSYPMARESGNDGEGRARRRPLNIRDAFTLKIPAGLLLNDIQFRRFLRFLLAHKIEVQRTIGGKLQWVEYDLDADSNLPDPDHPEDIDRLRSYSLKLVQADATWYTDFEGVINDFENS